MRDKDLLKSGAHQVDGLPPAASFNYMSAFSSFFTDPSDREVVVRSLLSTTTKGNTDRPR